MSYSRDDNERRRLKRAQLEQQLRALDEDERPNQYAPPQYNNGGQYWSASQQAGPSNPAYAVRSDEWPAAQTYARYAPQQQQTTVPAREIQTQVYPGQARPDAYREQQQQRQPPPPQSQQQSTAPAPAPAPSQLNTSFQAQVALPSREQVHTYLVQHMKKPLGLYSGWRIEGAQFHIYELFSAVLRAGGSSEVTRRDLWPVVATVLWLPPAPGPNGLRSSVAVAGLLRKFYLELLGGLEILWDQTKTLDDASRPGSGDIDRRHARQKQSYPMYDPRSAASQQHQRDQALQAQAQEESASVAQAYDRSTDRYYGSSMMATYPQYDQQARPARTRETSSPAQPTTMAPADMHLFLRQPVPGRAPQAAVEHLDTQVQAEAETAVAVAQAEPVTEPAAPAPKVKKPRKSKKKKAEEEAAAAAASASAAAIDPVLVPETQPEPLPEPVEPVPISGAEPASAAAEAPKKKRARKKKLPPAPEPEPEPPALVYHDNGIVKVADFAELVSSKALPLPAASDDLLVDTAGPPMRYFAARCQELRTAVKRNREGDPYRDLSPSEIEFWNKLVSVLKHNPAVVIPGADYFKSLERAPEPEPEPEPDPELATQVPATKGKKGGRPRMPRDENGNIIRDPHAPPIKYKKKDGAERNRKAPELDENGEPVVKKPRKSVPNVVDEHGQPIKRKQGRPRKSGVTEVRNEEGEIIKVVVSSAPEPAKKRAAPQQLSMAIVRELRNPRHHSIVARSFEPSAAPLPPLDSMVTVFSVNPTRRPQAMETADGRPIALKTPPAYPGTSLKRMLHISRGASVAKVRPHYRPVELIPDPSKPRVVPVVEPEAVPAPEPENAEPEPESAVPVHELEPEPEPVLSTPRRVVVDGVEIGFLSLAARSQYKTYEDPSEVVEPVLEWPTFEDVPEAGPSEAPATPRAPEIPQPASRPAKGKRLRSYVEPPMSLQPRQTRSGLAHSLVPPAPRGTRSGRTVALPVETPVRRRRVDPVILDLQEVALPRRTRNGAVLGEVIERVPTPPPSAPRRTRASLNDPVARLVAEESTPRRTRASMNEPVARVTVEESTPRRTRASMNVPTPRTDTSKDEPPRRARASMPETSRRTRGSVPEPPTPRTRTTEQPAESSRKRKRAATPPTRRMRSPPIRIVERPAKVAPRAVAKPKALSRAIVTFADRSRARKQVPPRERAPAPAPARRGELVVELPMRRRVEPRVAMDRAQIVLDIRPRRRQDLVEKGVYDPFRDDISEDESERPMGLRPLIPVKVKPVRPSAPEAVPVRFFVRPGAELDEPSRSVLVEDSLTGRTVEHECGWKGCDSVLASEALLKRHVQARRHTAQGAFQVGIAELWRCHWYGCEEPCFELEAGLWQHVVARHVSRVLYCPYDECDMTSPTVSHLARHVMRHHDQADDKPVPLANLSERLAPPPLPDMVLPVSTPTAVLTTPPVLGSVSRSVFRNEWVRDKVARKCIAPLEPRLEVDRQAQILRVDEEDPLELSVDEEEPESEPVRRGKGRLVVELPSRRRRRAVSVEEEEAEDGVADGAADDGEGEDGAEDDEAEGGEEQDAEAEAEWEDWESEGEGVVARGIQDEDEAEGGANETMLQGVDEEEWLNGAGLGLGLELELKPEPEPEPEPGLELELVSGLALEYDSEEDDEEELGEEVGDETMMLLQQDAFMEGEDGDDGEDDEGEAPAWGDETLVLIDYPSPTEDEPGEEDAAGPAAEVVVSADSPRDEQPEHVQQADDDSDLDILVSGTPSEKEMAPYPVVYPRLATYEDDPEEPQVGMELPSFEV